MKKERKEITFKELNDLKNNCQIFQKLEFITLHLIDIDIGRNMQVHLGLEIQILC